MINLKINKLFLLGLTTMFLITGCSKTGEVKEVSSTKQEIIKEEVTTTPVNEVETTTTPSNEEETFNCFSDERKTIEEDIKEGKLDEALKKGKELFITAVDFKFYDKEINGVTYDELKDEAKEVTNYNLSQIDKFIMEIDPDYKETTSDKWSQFKDFYTEKKEIALNKLEELIGSDSYNGFKSAKDEIKESTKEGYSKVKEKIGNIYQNFKNND